MCIKTNNIYRGLLFKIKHKYRKHQHIKKQRLIDWKSKDIKTRDIGSDAGQVMDTAVHKQSLSIFDWKL
jgi:hypothetical protein